MWVGADGCVIEKVNVKKNHKYWGTFYQLKLILKFDDMSKVAVKSQAELKMHQVFIVSSDRSFPMHYMY